MKEKEEEKKERMGEGEGDTTFHARSIVGERETEREIFILFFLFTLFIFISLRSPDLGGIVYIPGGGFLFFGANRYITAA